MDVGITGIGAATPLGTDYRTIADNLLAGRSGGEVDAVLDGQTGVLVNGESVDDIASALNALLGDPERLRRLGEAGRMRVETTHNWSAAAGVVDGVLDQIA